MARQEREAVEAEFEEESTEEDSGESAESAESEAKEEKHHKKNALSQFTRALKENKKILGIAFLIALLLITICYSIHFRLMPAYLPATEEWARESVQNFYKSQIQNDVNQRYAYLPAANRQQIVDQQYQQFLEERKDTIDQQTADIADNFRSQLQDNNNQTYLLEIDPYMHYRYVLNYLENGHVGNIMVNGKSYNTLRYGQIPKFESPRFHPWLIAKIYTIMHAFHPDISVMRSMFFFPVIFCTIAVIPAFFIGRKLGGNLGGLVAALIIVIHPSILGRTVAGFSDTDSYNVFIPLFVTWFLIEMLSSKSRTKTVVLGLLSGALMGIYSIAWSGWWYLFDFIMAFIAGMCAFCLIKHYVEYRRGQVKHIFQEDFKRYLFVGILIFVFSFLFIFILGLIFSKVGAAESLRFFFGRTFLEPFNFVKYKEVAITKIWPNVLTTVAELNLISLSKVISYLGVVSWGSILFMASAVGIVLLMIKKEHEMPRIDKWFIGIAIVWYVLLVKLQQSITTDAITFGVLLALPLLAAIVLRLFFSSELRIEYSLFFTIFLAATVFSSTRGVRFVALAVLAYAILLGASLGRIHKYASNWISSSMKVNKLFSQAILFILICVLVLPGQLSAANRQAKNELPMVTDAWHDTLGIVRDNSEKAITTSWWDWGHWFVALSNRSVTFDGGSQGIRIHPVGKTLLTDSEDEAIDILRMLNCGEEESAKLLENYTGDQYKSVKLLFRIIGESKDTARKTLLDHGLKPAQADKVLNYTHCEPIDQFYIASSDMIGKSGVWAHFGSWDFARATMFNMVKPASYEEGIKVLTGKFNLSAAEAEKTYSEIKASDGDQFVTEWPSYAGESSAQCQLTNQTILCQNRFQSGYVLLEFNISSEEAKIRTSSYAKRPNSISFIDNEGNFKVKEYYNDTAGISAAIYTKGGSIMSVMMEPKLVASMFTRLYFFQGVGLKHFRQLSYKKDVLGQESYLYRVIWNPEANATIPANSTTQ